MRRSILASFLIVGAVAAILATVTIAPFSDSETSKGNTVAAGTLDLTVNGQNDPLPAVCTVGPLAESTTEYCGPIKVKNVGNLDGIADIHFVASSCSPGAEPESETPSGVCNIDKNLEVDVVYDESVDGECSEWCSYKDCDCACAKCAAGNGDYCDKVEKWGCECGGPPPPTPEPEGETVYLPPTLLPDVLRRPSTWVTWKQVRKTRSASASTSPA